MAAARGGASRRQQRHPTQPLETPTPTETPAEDEGERQAPQPVQYPLITITTLNIRPSSTCLQGFSTYLILLLCATAYFFTLQNLVPNVASQSYI